jgi:hypothetical protein
VLVNIVVFLGPSLPPDEARRLCPARFLPPAGQADLLSAVTRYRPDAIALIDGVFGHSLSVWHKEILYALDRGVAVYGGSSMGALRAVETSLYGMIGFGEVFRMYADGEIDGDDEVALAHGDASVGFVGLSLPMVNVRKTFARAREDGLIDSAEHDQAIAAVRSIFFADRTIEAVGTAPGLSPDLSARLVEALTYRYVDVKRTDAEGLLRHLATVASVPQVTRPRLTRSHLFEAMYQRDRLVDHDGTAVRLGTIAYHVALSTPDFASLNEAALNRALAVVLAETLGATVDATEIAVERVRLVGRLGLAEADTLEAWARRNDLEPEDLNEFVQRQALVRKMQHWLISRRYLERTTRLVLDELRLAGRYEAVAAEAAQIEAVIAANYPNFQQAPGLNIDLVTLLTDHLARTGIRLDTDYQEWLFEAGFKDGIDLRFELLRHRLAREKRAAVAEELKRILAGGLADAD